MPYEIRCTTMTKRDPNRKGIKPHGVNSGVMIAQRSVRPGEKILIGDALYIRLQPVIQRYLDCGLITIQQLPVRVTAPSVITRNTEEPVVSVAAPVEVPAESTMPDVGDEVDMSAPTDTTVEDAVQAPDTVSEVATPPVSEPAVEAATDMPVDATAPEAAKIVQPAVRRTASVRKVV